MPIKHYIDHGKGKIEEVEQAEFDANLKKAREARSGKVTATKTESKATKAADNK